MRTRSRAVASTSTTTSARVTIVSSYDGAVAPRLGFSFDLTDDERHVVFGGAGRSYDRNVFEYLARETTKGSFPTYEYWFDSPTDPARQCASRGNLCLGPFNPVYYDPATTGCIGARESRARRRGLPARQRI